MSRQRLSAFLALTLCSAALIVILATAIRQFPRSLLVLALLGLALAAVWAALRRRDSARIVGLIVAGVLALLAAGLAVTGGAVIEAIVATGLVVGGIAATKATFNVHVHLPPATPPSHPMVVWNPRSGGGKALSSNLAAEAAARGIESVELKPGDDLVDLVRAAIDRGADGLAAAGGDGTQAIVAMIAAEHNLPFACIPAGTRNHFALDLGVDRDDVVGALDAFVNGGERVVDLAEVNGRVFVNNVSLGVYAEAVQREGYRDAKLKTLLNTVPDVLGTDASGAELSWTDPAGAKDSSAGVILVSNNVYRLGRLVGSGTRPRMDAGELGVAVVSPHIPGRDSGGSRRWRQWSAPTFTVDSNTPVPTGIDGEAVVLEPPLRFVSRPGALRVRIAPQHPGASPSAAEPDGVGEMFRTLASIALGKSALN